MSSTKGTVLVTGVTGFIGTDVALAFLRAGWRVKGTVRSKAKADDWIAIHSEWRAQCEYVVVEDIAAPHAFDEAVKGCDVIAHTASPYIFSLKDNEKDMLLPAINGTKNILEATKLEPRIKRVVLTSSIAAMMDPLTLPAVGTTYDQNSWNPATYEEAKQHPIGGFVYSASKSLAEHAFWDFIKKEKPTWSGTVLCPAQVFGPASQKVDSLSTVNTSTAFFYQAINGTWKASGVPPTMFPVYTDVRTLGVAHVKAAELDVAKGKRYIFSEGYFKNEEVIDVAARFFPELKDKLPTVDVSSVTHDDHFKANTRNTEEDLGIKFVSFETMTKDTIAKLLELEKTVGA